MSPLSCWFPVVWLKYNDLSWLYFNTAIFGSSDKISNEVTYPLAAPTITSPTTTFWVIISPTAGVPVQSLRYNEDTEEYWLSVKTWVDPMDVGFFRIPFVQI